MVSYELKKLLQTPSVKSQLNANHFMKFQQYFKQSLDVLMQDEHSNSNQDLGKKKHIKFSSCFTDLA